MKRKTSNYCRGLATACLFAFGATVLGIGTTALEAQGPSPSDTCSTKNTGNLCMEGEICLLFFCIEWETYWPETGAPLQ